jgi:hypothetical protein
MSSYPLWRKAGQDGAALGKTMASDTKKTKADPAPKAETAPKKDTSAKVESTAAKDAPKEAAKDAPKSEGSEPAAAPSSYSRGEGQKPVTAAYKENWNAIFAKKKTKKKKR